jgi:hypothetical protein
VNAVEDTFAANVKANVARGWRTPEDARLMLERREAGALQALTDRGIPEDLARFTITQPDCDLTALWLSCGNERWLAASKHNPRSEP